MPSPPFDLPVAVRTAFAASGRAEYLNDLIQKIRDLGRYRRDFVYYGAPGKGSELDQAIANCRFAQQAHLHRVENLVAGATASFGENNTHSFALLVRGIYESVGVLGYICNRIGSQISGNIEFDQLIDDIAFVVVGAKEVTFKDAPDPPNIMTCLQKADKFLNAEFFKKKADVLVDNYNWLSEWAHPNFLSNNASMRLYKELGGFSFLREDAPHIEESGLLQYLDMGVDLFAPVVGTLDGLIQNRFSSEIEQ